ncbi:MAG: squalene/phytoene synthase family protein, partial [Pseudomonadota bacterium]
EAWDMLARALHDDIDAKSLHSWQDFEHYSEHASSSSAWIFLSLVLHEYNLPLSDLRSIANVIAQYCYLVHIMRDLRKDALHPKPLWTIPDAAFAEIGCARKQYHQAIIAGGDGIELLHSLDFRAQKHRARALEQIHNLCGQFGKTAYPIAALFSIYMEIHNHYHGAKKNFLDSALPLAKLRKTAIDHWYK